MARQRAPLPLGSGVDRDTGSTTVQPYTFHDLRNVYLSPGRMEFRKGLERKFVTPGAVISDILGIWPLSASGGQTAIAVYHRGSKQVWLYVADAAGNVSEAGFLWNILPGAIDPPRVLAAEAYSKLILAHDEPQYALRGITVVLDVPTRTTDVLRADWAGPVGAPHVKFRGVERYLNYVIGWGFGDADDPNRPEILRISMPGEPLVYDKMHYFLVGQRGDPIIGGGFSGSLFAVQKVAETYGLHGYDRETFGIRPLDVRYGLAVSRLRLSVEGDYYFWSPGHGPRMIAGGTTESIELPLDLDGPLPEATLDPDDYEHAFAMYDPFEDEVIFVFGDFGFCLHRKDESPRWSYRKYAKPLMSAGMIFVGAVGGAIDIGSEPVLASVLPVEVITYEGDDVNPRFHVGWTSTSPPPPGTQAELWVRSHQVPGIFSTWQRKWVGDPNLGAMVTPYLHDFLADHDIAMRYMLFGSPGLGYDSADPGDWPAAARMVGTTGGDIAGFVIASPQPHAGGWLTLIDTYDGVGKGRMNGEHWGNFELTFEIEQSIDGGAFTPYYSSSGEGAKMPNSIDWGFVSSGQTVQARVRVVGRDDTAPQSAAWFNSNFRVIP